MSDVASFNVGMTCFAVVLLIPMMVYVVAIWQPLKPNANATRFRGKYWGWHLTHDTGKVLTSQRHTETYGGGRVYGGSDSGTVTGSEWVRTDVHDTLNLVRADGSETAVEVINFNVSARPGSVVSIWNARKGNRALTFAVLNHTTNQQYINQQQLFSIMQPRQSVWVVYAIMLAIPMLFCSFLVSNPLPIVLFFVLFGLYAWGQKRIRGEFNSSGMSAIWTRSRTEAQPLLVP